MALISIAALLRRRWPHYRFCAANKAGNIAEIDHSRRGLRGSSRASVISCRHRHYRLRQLAGFRVRERLFRLTSQSHFHDRRDGLSTRTNWPLLTRLPMLNKLMR